MTWQQELEIVDRVMRDISGITGYDMLQAHGGIQWPFPEGSPPPAERERRLFEDGCFFHPDGRARFCFEDPRPTRESTSTRFPLVLLTGRGSAAEWHTRTRTGKSALLRSLAPAELYVEVSPEDAAARGIRPGDRVEVASVRAAMGPLAAVFWHHPSQELTVMGVTGTAGSADAGGSTGGAAQPYTPSSTDAPPPPGDRPIVDEERAVDVQKGAAHPREPADRGGGHARIRATLGRGAQRLDRLHARGLQGRIDAVEDAEGERHAEGEGHAQQVDRQAAAEEPAHGLGDADAGRDADVKRHGRTPLTVPLLRRRVAIDDGNRLSGAVAVQGARLQ